MVNWVHQKIHWRDNEMIHKDKECKKREKQYLGGWDTDGWVVTDLADLRK